ncbi:MAG: winged helix-turn-helix domain-containing protein, partial [Kiloniellales bacterium]|nr:winged helix-turn-helix domain-containing protein [Kiloniellales bacterium]
LKETNNVPILLLTAMSEVEDRISGLECGADDYLGKPFEPRELVLRINSILRRSPLMAAQQQGPVSFGKFSFNLQSEELLDAGERVHLTSMETLLLKTLAAKRGDPVSREQLCEASGLQTNERTVDVQVARLRRKIEDNPRFPRYLQTVRGIGYVLMAV